MTISNETIYYMLERMLKIRFFEEKLKEIHKHNIPGMVHLYIGEEAVAVGVCANLADLDYITSTHRGHGHVIAKGADVKGMMAELFGRRDGLCKGKGGSMHVADVSLGILGANGIVGGGITLAAGAGLACKLKHEERVAVCFFGDGASNQGALQESLNLCSVWKLPVIYVCENNLYHEFSPSAPVLAGTIAGRGVAYDVPGVSIDGMDVLAVYDAAKTAVDRARNGEGPTLIEARTYRFESHDEGEFALIGTNYRSDKELAEWKLRDPIKQFQTWLLENGHMSEQKITEIKQQIKQEIEEAVVFASQSAWPAPEEAYNHVFVQ